MGGGQGITWSSNVTTYKAVTKFGHQDLEEGDIITERSNLIPMLQTVQLLHVK